MYFSTKPLSVRFFYNLLTHLAWLHLKLIALFNQKIRLFVKGRQESFIKLGQIDPKNRLIWMHVASLGEYEQGLPLLEKLRLNYPNHKLVLTFFSPSGYEIKKDKTPADYVVYLPMDTFNNVKRFLGLVKPELAIFIKYEIWPNYLHQLKKQHIPILLVSAIFSKRQIYFKPFGGFMRKALKNFNHFFVQDENSKQLLKNIGFENITISGDTRFDRVSEILNNNNHLDFMEVFKGSNPCFVFGSAWPEDEAVIIGYINKTEDKKFVIAPHNIKEKHIVDLTTTISKKTVRYSEYKEQDLQSARVLVMDTIGLLTKVYSYADVAYVGGGFETGLHNTLEPAVFGIPVLIGPNYKGFKEAEDLVELGGVISIQNKKKFEHHIEQLWNDKKYYQETGLKNSDYINKNKGATAQVATFIKGLIKI